jgi:hypothetical protein
MNALPHHDVWQRDTCCQDPDTHLAVHWLRALLLEDTKRVWPAVMINDDALVSRGHVHRTEQVICQRKSPPSTPGSGAIRPVRRRRGLPAVNDFGAAAQDSTPDCFLAQP